MFYATFRCYKILEYVQYKNKHLDNNTKVPGIISDVRDSKNGSYLLSHLVGQYHRRW